MLDEDPMLRIEGALRDAAEIEARRAGRAEQDDQVREICQLHQSLMASVGKVEGAQRLTDNNLSDLIETVDRIAREKL